MQSDHKPLETIFKKQISATTPRLQRMLLRLMKYSLRIEYVPGSKMFIADTLSRAYLPHKPTDADRELAEDIDVTVHSVAASYPASEHRLRELREGLRVHFSTRSTRKKRKVPVNYAFLKWTTGDATHLKITCMRSATHLK